MTSEERKEARYRRRREKRATARDRAVGDADRYDAVFTYGNLYQAYRCCRRGVSWKASVQAYKARCGINVARRVRELNNGEFRLRRSPEFITRERGHERRINSIHIEDRVPQKCLCKYSLKPARHRLPGIPSWRRLSDAG